jgi:cellulose biosynthesis protein BcsQ
MKTIAVYNNKGGVGKTTFAVHLALFAADRRIKTLVVCLDGQGDVCRWLSGGECTIEDGLTFDHGNYLKVTYSPMTLPEDLKGFDLVIADCPPAREIAGEIDADLWLVPLDGRLALENLANIHREICDGTGDVMIVLNRCDLIGKRALEALRKAVHKFPSISVREAPIPASGPIAKTAEYFRAVWDVPNGEGTIGDRAIQRLCTDVLTGCGFAGQL